MGMPVAKAKDFRTSLRRLLGRLRPHRLAILFVVLLAVVGVALTIAGPKLLGNATQRVFEGVVSRELPAGVTKEQAVAALRAQGEGRRADMLASMQLTPGHGVDFTALGRLLLLVVGVYLLSAVFSWISGYLMAGVTQRMVYTLREDVDTKLGRLPLSYSRHPRPR